MVHYLQFQEQRQLVLQLVLHNYISASVNKLNYLITDINAPDEELVKIQDANPTMMIHKVEPLSSAAINQE